MSNEVREFSRKLLDGLLFEAKLLPRRRQHLNVHASHQESCQRLFNAIGMDSYIRPHRHLKSGRSETLLAVRGVFSVISFLEDGEIQDVSFFGTECHAKESSLSVGVEISPHVWHSVLALKDDSVVFEVKEGPFLCSEAKEFAHWAPEEGSESCALYFSRLRQFAENALAHSSISNGRRHG